MSLSVFDAAADAPDRPALIAVGRIHTYRELAGAAGQALDWLDGRGLRSRPEQAVALVARNTVPVIEMLHALIAAAVPVHLIHPRLAEAERARLVERSGARLVLEADWRDPDHDDAGDTRRAQPRTADPRETLPADGRPLAVTYTSGSSGAPKGVVLSRRAFATSAAASAANLGWREDDRWLLRLPLAHVGGLSILTRCLLARRCVVLADAGDVHARRPDDDAAALTATIRRDRVTILSLVPTLLRRLLDVDPPWDPPPHLRAILLGGAAAPADLLGRAADRRWPVLTTYGMSECCSQVATQRPGTTNRGDLGAGPPLPGVEVRIRAEEIQVRGDILFSGYHPAEEFPSPFLPGGWFATGDRGSLDDQGRLHVAGRRDDVIITGGENVDPAAVEEALRAVPGVRDACVFGVPDEQWGEKVCAAVVRDAPDASGKGAVPLDGPALVELLKGSLAGFRIPRSIVFVPALPVGPTGKLDRRRVRDLYDRHGERPA